MGAKTWMLAYSNGKIGETLRMHPDLDRDKTKEIVSSLFPDEKLKEEEDVDLSEMCPPEDKIYAGYFSGVFFVAAKEFGIDFPSQLNPSFIRSDLGDTVHLHAMHSVVDWTAFAVWKKGELKRSLSLSSDHGIIEDIGEKLYFEQRYWNGEKAEDNEFDEDDNYPFPFHPLDLGNDAVGEFFGYILEGKSTPDMVEPFDFPLMSFSRSKSMNLLSKESLVAGFKSLNVNLKYALYMVFIYIVSLLVMNVLDISDNGFDRNNVRGLGRILVLTIICIGVLKKNSTATKLLYWGSFLIAFLSLILVGTIVLGHTSLSMLTEGQSFPLLGKVLLILTLFTSAASAKYMYLYRKATG